MASTQELVGVHNDSAHKIHNKQTQVGKVIKTSTQTATPIVLGEHRQVEVLGTVGVVYFDQCLGAAHSKR